MNDYAESLGLFMETSPHLRAMVSLSLPCKSNLAGWRTRFDSFVALWRSCERVNLGWARSIELKPTPHLHALIFAPRPVDCFLAKGLFRQCFANGYAASAEIEPYHLGHNGAAYIFKTMGTATDEIELSPNLDAFWELPNGIPAKVRSSHRRHLLRTVEQCRRYAQS
jgi:hypothetical protein